MEFEQALGIVRLMVNGGIAREIAICNSAIPEEHRVRIKEILEQEETIILEPARMLVANAQRSEWLNQFDRSSWYYWPKLREYLLGKKRRSEPAVRSLDETTDRILGQLAPPSTKQFDIRGLVVGYVQSGKTENYTALIAKAADVGYRLVIVLSGIDNGLRRQTQIRLKKELVGYPDNRPDAVRLPPSGKQWHQFTNEEFNGDFQPGFANDAALQGTQPVLLVVKKNGMVLRRLHRYLDLAQDTVKQNLPVLIIDDEADQASIDTRGSYLAEGESNTDDYEEPTVINGLIRDLLNKFTKITYIAYTATPFANILIPHDTYDPTCKNDLYPRDFIVDLPKPINYFGAEELFGRFDPDTEEDIGGLDVIRHVPDQDTIDLKQGMLPASLETAMIDFVLSGACRALRKQGAFPATMLIHGSHLIQPQLEVEKLVSRRYAELKDEWRYQRKHGFRERLKKRWEQDFRPRLNPRESEPDISFEMIEPYIGPFLESVYVRVINSTRPGEILDYEREPDLKAIAIGGNRLSRGLTLEGLLVSYFVRSSATYDTLMQMGRWFGFRGGYEDITRIYMPEELSGWFRDLALVEHELRRDIRVYEVENLTPLQIGTRILRHPAMLVTSRLKQRYGQQIIIEQSYSNRSMETIRFPLQRLDDLNSLLSANLATTISFLQKLGSPSWDAQGATWAGITPEKVLDFLNNYRMDREVRNISLPLVCDYIERQNNNEELTKWTVSVRGLEKTDSRLGEIDLGIGRQISLNGRSRLRSDPDSIGSISSPKDEGIGLTKQQLDEISDRLALPDKNIGFRSIARSMRSPEEGLLLIYPISRFSGYDKKIGESRKPLFDDPNDPRAQQIMGIALSFPKSDKALVVLGEYIVGTVGWRSYEQD
jgi:hypothetical protein